MTQPKRKGKNAPGAGGRRPGAGRKSSEATKFREFIRQEKLDDARAAWELVQAVRRGDAKALRLAQGEAVPLKLQYEAAVYTLNQVIGMPKQHMEVSDDRGLRADDDSVWAPN
jgi:hypothetical protein